MTTKPVQDATLGIGAAAGAVGLAYLNRFVPQTHQSLALGVSATLAVYSASKLIPLIHSASEFASKQWDTFKNRPVSLLTGITSCVLGGAAFGFGNYLGLGALSKAAMGLATMAGSAIYCSAPVPAENPPIRAALPAPSGPMDDVLNWTPQFNGYRIGGGATTLLGMPVRPANLLFNAIAADARNSFGTTRPGQGLFAWTGQTDKIRDHIERESIRANELSFTAAGTNLAAVYGNNVYRISYRELLNTLNSQKIYLSPDLSYPFYIALKQAFYNDGIVTLPGNGHNPIKLKDLHNPSIRALVQQARTNPAQFGFPNRAALESFLNLTLYQIGAMVVKSEDFRILMDGDGHILPRNSGAPDAFRLINLCGIRAIHSSMGPENEGILRNTFNTALVAAENGVVIFPAVGMGVWKGPPDVYWPAFLDAVAHSGGNLEKIYVHPMGTDPEFRKHLHMARLKNQLYPLALANLDKIENLASRNTDLIQLAHNLKRQFPRKTISLVNASDPDVTLGNHVGEYVNTVSHGAPTTEENYTAMGTNGLCFEWITGVHAQPGRVIPL